MKRDTKLGLWFLGFSSLIVYGLYLVWPPLAWIAGGLLGVALTVATMIAETRNSSI